ncbi:hypothetical protein ACWIGM_02680 [Bosea sp. NPDC055332]
MKLGARFPLLATFAGLCAASSPAEAAPGFVSAPGGGVSAPAPRLAPMRPAARPGHIHPGRSGFYGGGYPGNFGWPGEQRVIIVQPEVSEPPQARDASVPVAIGIRRPPEADPVLYRIETRNGRPVVRVMRFSSDGQVARR